MQALAVLRVRRDVGKPREARFIVAPERRVRFADDRPYSAVSGGHRAVDSRWFGWPAGVRARVRDLWAHKDVGRWAGSIEATVEPHGVAMFRIDS